MSNHIKGNWFISVFKLRTMSVVDLRKVANSENYRPTTRRNAINELKYREQVPDQITLSSHIVLYTSLPGDFIEMGVCKSCNNAFHWGDCGGWHNGQHTCHNCMPDDEEE